MQNGINMNKLKFFIVKMNRCDTFGRLLFGIFWYYLVFFGIYYLIFYILLLKKTCFEIKLSFSVIAILKILSLTSLQFQVSFLNVFK